MARTSWLDDLIQRFQHRWETNAQYRTAMSGVLGIVLLLFLCSCVGLVTTGANVALASLGFGTGASDQSSGNTGTKEVKGVATFPIATYVPKTPNAIPQGTVPSSGTPKPTVTPQPTPTDTPLPTPCTTNCGGGPGGGGGCPSCTVNASASPSPWIHGQKGLVVVHTSKPNVGINIIVNYPGTPCSSQLNQGAGLTDGNGDYTWQVGSPPSAAVINPCTGTAQIIVQAGFNGGSDLKSFTFNQPVI